jgi:large subunit ribosomal protein L6
MDSFILPSNIKVYTTQGYVKRVGPFGSLIKKVDTQEFDIITGPEGNRFFRSKNNSVGLSTIYQLAQGLSIGVRRRLRLTGIGFRAISSGKENKENKDAINVNFITKKEISGDKLKLKIGFSHEINYTSTESVSIEASRIEGRTKGTLIYLKSNNCTNLNQIASEIRAFRMPDIYKGKGIYYDREAIKLKKGKRQG